MDNNAHVSKFIWKTTCETDCYILLAYLWNSIREIISKRFQDQTIKVSSTFKIVVKNKLPNNVASSSS